MTRSLIVVDNPAKWPIHIPGTEVVAARRYLTDPDFASIDRARVFNLCRSYRYQATGYYVSLLAAAREHRVLPSVATTLDLKIGSLVRITSDDLEAEIQRALKPLKSNRFDLRLYFGSPATKRYRRLATALFNQFPAPILETRFARKGRNWYLDAVGIVAAGDLTEDERSLFIEQATQFMLKPRRTRHAKAARYDIAISIDEHDPMPCSDPKAIKKFMAAAEQVGMRPWLIDKDDYGRLAEFDALFIRETTNVNHHSFRFARRAKAEGLAVIDEPDAVLKCTNKVYLAELLERHKLAAPKTLIFSSETAHTVRERIGFPCIIKQPDSSFSMGVKKVDSPEAFDQLAAKLLQESDLLIAQEFCPTEFDWRIGVLGGEPLYACRYYMAKSHWQIINHKGKTRTEGRADTLPVQDAPKPVVKLATRAARLVGDGLFGVDLKVVNGKPLVIEVNENPNINAGVEDAVLGDELYQRIMRWFVNRIEADRA